MKTKYGFIIIGFMLFSKIVFASDTTFKDIDNHWAKQNIIRATENGIVNGYADETFKPDEKVSAVEFLKMIIVAENYEIERVGKSVWPDFYIETAKKNNLIEKEFSDYNLSLTRNGAVDKISKVIDLTDVNKIKTKLKDLKSENKNNVLKLVNLGVIKGYSDKTFKGENNITRAEAVTIINRIIDAENQISINKKYSPEKKTNLSNYGTSANEYSYNYEIKNNEILIYDSGRYSNSDGYAISSKIINIPKVIKVIKSLIVENTYTEVVYSPSKYVINQLKILHGESKNQIEKGGSDFTFTYFEDDLYKLASSSMHDEFDDNCYLKIEVIKMWGEYSDFLEQKYIDEYKKKILADALQTEFGYQHAEKILEYMLEKNINYVSNIDRDKEHIDVKKIGNYIIYYYQKEYGVPTFYISYNKK